MSSKKLLFIISLVVLAGSLMSFNVNPESKNSNPDSYQDYDLEFLSDTLPGDVQERVAELHRKRDQIRKEVERIKAAEEAKAVRKAQAEKITAKKATEKVNKEAVAQIKAEEKAKLDAIKKREKAARKAAKAKIKAEQDAIVQQEQAILKAEADKLKAAQKAETDRLKAIKKAEAEKLALERKKRREAEAAAKAKIKAEQDAIAQKEQAVLKAEMDKLKAAQKVEADRLKAIKKAEAEKLALERKKRREAEAAAKAKIKAEQDAIAQQEQAILKAEADKLKAAQKAEADRLKAIKKAEKKAEAERLALERKQQRDAEATLKAQQKAEANRLKATQDAERQALKDKVAKAQANVNAAVISDEDPLKAAKKRDAEIAKAAKQKERDALKAARAVERERKAALREQQKAEAAAIAQAEAERRARAAEAAAAGLVYDEAPPGYETTPDVAVPSDTTPNPQLQAEPIEVANKKVEGEEVSKVKTEPILPPPPANDPTLEIPRDKTKDAVAKALEKDRKKRKRKGGIKLPGLGGKSDVPSEEILGECDFEFNEFDPITQKVKRGLSHRFFFSYTSDILKEYMQGEDYLLCTGGLIDIQGIIALNVKYVIDSPQARYEYGSIGTNAQMILQLIDGETITLLAEQSDSGRVNRSTGKTEFSTIFLINPREEKELRKTEISTVRMVWGTGYEDYEVNELDFLINQFQCIDAARDN